MLEVVRRSLNLRQKPVKKFNERLATVRKVGNIPDIDHIILDGYKGVILDIRENTLQ